jgi:L-ascorbate metabolism protein UlaG (beta-lactamase superfamily)
MVITWFGLSSFKISSGNLTLVTDPFSKIVGLTPPRGQTDIAVISNIQNVAYNNQEALGGENTFVIDGPGELDVKGLFVHGIAANGDPKAKTNGFDYTTIYSIRMEEIRLGFLGSLKQKELSDSQLEELGEVDILFIPVGGKSVCDAEEAVTIINQIEPKIVIPAHYAQSGLKIPLDKVDQFLKEIGSAKVVPQDKLTIKKSNLQEQSESTQTIVLNPQR